MTGGRTADRENPLRGESTAPEERTSRISASGECLPEGTLERLAERWVGGVPPRKR